MAAQIRVIFLSLLTCAFAPLFSQDPSPQSLKALYNSLDPFSIPQHLAFYELYPNSPEGSQALKDAYRLLTGSNNPSIESTLPLPLAPAVNAIVGLISKHNSDFAAICLKENELATIKKLAIRLPNRKLRGYYATCEKHVLDLNPDQIDLARALLLSQLGDAPETLYKVQCYEALIDLMALQILAKTSLQDAPKAKIRAINQFIFEELGFRFPPHSTYAKEIDLYTFLPSVLDSRRGVCLGVSILYICLAQRLNLDLEIVTPPGHIFVRWQKGADTINIETTARGIHLPDEEYLGVDNRALQKRSIKETIGMAHFNQAAVYLEREHYDKAFTAYAKALEYMPEDKQVISLMGYTAVLLGDETLAHHLLQQALDYLPDHAVTKDTLPEDYLKGNTSKEAIKAIFMRVDETRASLLAKKDALKQALINAPFFREALFSLAGTWLQLHRMSEALVALENYHRLDSENPTVEYYLAVLYAERMDYNKAWEHLRLAEKIVAHRSHSPDVLAEFRKELAEKYPE